jgi:hypothetical protein
MIGLPFSPTSYFYLKHFATPTQRRRIEIAADKSSKAPQSSLRTYVSFLPMREKASAMQGIVSEKKDRRIIAFLKP